MWSNALVHSKDSVHSSGFSRGKEQQNGDFLDGFHNAGWVVPQRPSVRCSVQETRCLSSSPNLV